MNFRGSSNPQEIKLDELRRCDVIFYSEGDPVQTVGLMEKNGRLWLLLTPTLEEEARIKNAQPVRQYVWKNWSGSYSFVLYKANTIDAEIYHPIYFNVYVFLRLNLKKMHEHRNFIKWFVGETLAWVYETFGWSV